MHTQFKRLDFLLLKYQSLWRFQPFHASKHQHFSRLKNAWLECYPTLMGWLMSLEQNDISKYKQSPTELMEAVCELLPELNELAELIHFSTYNRESAATSTLCFNRDKTNLNSGIPGRKWQQIDAMGAFLCAGSNGEEWLEWCAGKGYLGRYLATYTAMPVTSFEWQASLCQSGQKEADDRNLNMQFVQGDALSQAGSKVVRASQHAVALHACGDLHKKLLQYTTAANTQAVTISPCCYHLTEDEIYQPLSTLAHSSSLALTRAELRIPLQETVTGGKRVSRHRFLEMSYRLGFDSMIVETLKQEEYQPIPSIKKSELDLGFDYFCQWAANKKEITLPKIDYDKWHNKGIERFWLMERLSLLQNLFLRPIEVWLVLDRALFMHENGYKVSIYEFCSRHTTPRNLLIHCVRN